MLYETVMKARFAGMSPRETAAMLDMPVEIVAWTMIQVNRLLKVVGLNFDRNDPPPYLARVIARAKQRRDELAHASEVHPLIHKPGTEVYRDTLDATRGGGGLPGLGLHLADRR